MSRKLANTALLPGIAAPETGTAVGGSNDASHESVGIARVLLPALFAEPFDYRIDLSGDAPPMQPGAYVEVPFGRRTLTGVVWEIADSSAVALDKIKTILKILPLPPMDERLRRFIDWVAAYTMTPPGLVLKMALAGGQGRLQHEPKRARKSGKTAAAATMTAPVVPDLSPAQSDAASVLRAAVAGGRFAPILLDGVTGSGKTEVYCEAIASALAAGRQALVLLPEIALTAQLRERFSRRFGFAPAEWHSEMPDARRRDTWQSIVTGAVPLVLGARSALFLPYPRLGLIVADEEHEIFYKQEEGVIYQGRDLAILRAREENCPVILASATPSLETVANVESGRYRRVHLPERHAAARLPDIRLIDLRKNLPERGRWLSPPLVAAVDANLAAGEQSLLFLNRRGYAPLTLCRACGHRLQCPSCSAWLVAHGGNAKIPAADSGAKAARLVCHHCDYSRPMPPACPQCAKPDQLAACGPGVERLAEEAALRWPSARIAVLASDIAGGGVGILDVIERMERREIDILIGTALVAKGHHFPWLTLVGVVDADMGLAGGDLRAGERTYQVLHQVAGRSGRAAKPGRVLIQTAAPDHPAMQALASGKRDAFIAEQIAERRTFGMPPFGRLAALILSASDATLLDRFARDLGHGAPKAQGIKVLGPAIAPLALLRGRHRRRFLVKGGKDQRLQPYIEEWLRRLPCPTQIRIQIDIDPYNFM